MAEPYKAEDWKIWTYQPVPNTFILDFSQLDDAGAPLSATEGTIEINDSLIAGITIHEGTTPTNGIFLSPTPATATIEVTMTDFTKTDSNKFLVGTEIWITFKNDEDYDNAYNNLGKNTPVFMGRIRSFDVNIQPDSNIASIRLEASSKTQDELNKLLTIDTNTASYKTTLIEAAVETYGYYIDLAFSSNYFYARSKQTKTYGEWLSEHIATTVQIPADYVWYTSQTGSHTAPNIVFENGIRSKSNVLSVEYPGWDFTEADITSVELGWSNASSPTGVTLTNDANSSLVYQFGSDQSTGGGMYNATVDLSNIDDMIAAGNIMLNFNKYFTPISIETITARVGEPIVWGVQGDSYSVTLLPRNLAFIGYAVTVTMLENGFDEEKMFIVGRTIEVTPDDWKTTYNLWKGRT